MKKIVLFLMVMSFILPFSAVYFKIGDYYTPDFANYFAMSDNIVYVAGGESGLLIIDVSNPQNPVLLGSYGTSGYAYSVFVSNNIAYVAAWDAGLQIIDVSNPQYPSFLGSYFLGGNGRSVFVSNWLVKGKGIPYPEIINKTKRKLIKNKIKGYINGSY